MLRVMPETRGRDTGSLYQASGEPDALKGASPVRISRVVAGSIPVAPARRHLGNAKPRCLFVLKFP